MLECHHITALWLRDKTIQDNNVNQGQHMQNGNNQEGCFWWYSPHQWTFEPSISASV